MKLLVLHVPGLSPSLVAKSRAQRLRWIYGAGQIQNFESNRFNFWQSRFAIETGRNPRKLGLFTNRVRARGTYEYASREHLEIGVPTFADIVLTALGDIGVTSIRTVKNEGESLSNIFRRAQDSLGSKNCSLVYVLDNQLEALLRTSRTIVGSTDCLHETVGQYLADWDEGLGQLLDSVAENLGLVIVSPYELIAPRQILAANDWLAHENWLILDRLSPRGASLNLNQVDWRRSRAYCVCDGSSAAVYFNLQGRDPHGILSDSEAEDLANSIRDAWQSLGPLEFEWMSGRSFGEAWVGPDAVYHFTEGGTAFEESIGHPRRMSSQDDYLGVSSMCATSGYILFLSESMPAFMRDRQTSVLDLAPTLLGLLGIQSPEGLDGTSIVATDCAPQPSHMNAEQLLRDRLRGLGYIE